MKLIFLMEIVAEGQNYDEVRDYAKKVISRGGIHSTKFGTRPIDVKSVNHWEVSCQP